MTEIIQPNNIEILNQILKEVRELKEDMNNIKSIISTVPTKKDLETFKLINEMEENSMWGNEEDLKKSGIQL